LWGGLGWRGWGGGGGFGKTGKGSQAVTPQTLFSIQSMFKTFTATAITIAMRGGLVDLDAPVTKYQPGLFSTFSGEMLDLPRPMQTWRNVRITK
jgi:CubicO group peptidase (beta-lactamase class C family)